MQPVAPSGDATQAAIPAPVRFDPLASFLTTPIEVEIGGRVFAIPHRPAVFWLGVMLDEPIEWDAVLVDALDDEDQQWLEDGLLDGSLDHEEANKAILDVLAVVSGLKWWVALNLCAVARNNWDRIGGALALSGMDLEKMTFGAWLTALFHVLMDRIDPKQAANFVAELTRAPEGWEEEIDPAEEEASFLAAMAMM